jgi:hypothetical protein
MHAMGTQQLVGVIMTINTPLSLTWLQITLHRYTTTTYHVDDLGQCHLQGHVQSLVCVCHRSQGTCVVGEEITEQLVSQPAFSSQAL